MPGSLEHVPREVARPSASELSPEPWPRAASSRVQDTSLEGGVTRREGSQKQEMGCGTSDKLRGPGWGEVGGGRGISKEELKEAGNGHFWARGETFIESQSGLGWKAP